MIFPRDPSDSPMASVDGERDHDGRGDPLLLGADLMAASGHSDGEWDRTEADGGERTIGAGGISVIIEGNKDNNGSLGYDLW